MYDVYISLHPYQIPVLYLKLQCRIKPGIQMQISKWLEFQILVLMVCMETSESYSIKNCVHNTGQINSNLCLESV